MSTFLGNSTISFYSQREARACDLAAPDSHEE
jgi:hypothetical protein